MNFCFPCSTILHPIFDVRLHDITSFNRRLERRICDRNCGMHGSTKGAEKDWESILQSIQSSKLRSFQGLRRTEEPKTELISLNFWASGRAPHYTHSRGTSFKIMIFVAPDVSWSTTAQVLRISTCRKSRYSSGPLRHQILFSSDDLHIVTHDYSSRIQRTNFDQNSTSNSRVAIVSWYFCVETALWVHVSGMTWDMSPPLCRRNKPTHHIFIRPCGFRKVFQCFQASRFSDSPGTILWLCPARYASIPDHWHN